MAIYFLQNRQAKARVLGLEYRTETNVFATLPLALFPSEGSIVPSTLFSIKTHGSDETILTTDKNANLGVLRSW